MSDEATPKQKARPIWQRLGDPNDPLTTADTFRHEAGKRGGTRPPQKAPAISKNDSAVLTGIGPMRREEAALYAGEVREREALRSYIEGSE